MYHHDFIYDACLSASGFMLAYPVNAHDRYM